MCYIQLVEIEENVVLLLNRKHHSGICLSPLKSSTVTPIVIMIISIFWDMFLEKIRLISV
jgi:hypothetical protein